MKHLKTFCLVAVATGALLAFAGTASATYVTTTTGGSVATPTFHLVNEGGHIRFTNPIANIDCSSTIEGNIESHGAFLPAVGNVFHFTFTGCTNIWHVTTVSFGKLSIYWTSGHNGELRSTGAKIDATRFGVTCVYETSNTKLGTITGGKPARVHIEGSIPINDFESSDLCGTSNSNLSGKYESTSELYIAP